MYGSSEGSGKSHTYMYTLRNLGQYILRYTVCRIQFEVITVVYPFKWNTVFGNNIKSKMGILNLIRKIYFNHKTLTKNIF